MTEKRLIQETKNPLTIGILVEDFKKMGMEEGDVLLVHSSLSNMGWVCGGAQSVIMALFQVLGEKGTLVMPTMTTDLSDPKMWGNPPVPESWWKDIYESMPTYRKDLSPCCAMGKIPETFRKVDGVLRSAHPLTSFAAWGLHKEEIISNHLLDSKFGKNSPLEHLYEKSAKVLLLGISYSACSCFHLGEALWKGMKKEKERVLQLKNGKNHWEEVEDFAYDAGDFDLLGLDFDQSKQVKKGSVGQAGSRLFSIRAAVDFAVDWFAQNR